MAARLFVVHGSHPCLTVEDALTIKGVPYKKVELVAGTQPAVMTLLFGGRTVPGIRFDDGLKVQGSRAILRELERRAPDPPLYGGPEIEEAERWGDEVLQPMPRTLLWAALTKSPQAMYDFQDGQRMPKLPRPAVRLAAPLVLAIERRLNASTPGNVRDTLRRLPEVLDHVDELITEGVIGGERPNAAELQIAPSIRLLWALEDLRPLIAGRPAHDLAFRRHPPMKAVVPKGSLPGEWIPVPAR